MKLLLSIAATLALAASAHGASLAVTFAGEAQDFPSTGSVRLSLRHLVDGGRSVESAFDRTYDQGPPLTVEIPDLAPGMYVLHLTAGDLANLQAPGDHLRDYQAHEAITITAPEEAATRSYSYRPGWVELPEEQKVPVRLPVADVTGEPLAGTRLQAALNLGNEAWYAVDEAVVAPDGTLSFTRLSERGNYLLRQENPHVKPAYLTAKMTGPLLLPPLEGRVAPDFDMLPPPGAEGEPLQLSDLRGQVVVLDVWATWCGPCHEPLANLEAMLARHPEWKGQVTAIALSVDDNLPALQKYLDRKQWKHLQARRVNPVDVKNEEWVFEPLAVSVIPRTFVFDREGRVRAYYHPELYPLEQIISELVK